MQQLLILKFIHSFTPCYARSALLVYEGGRVKFWGTGRSRDAVYPHSLPLDSPSLLADPVAAYNLSHQSLFLRSRCFPMSAGPLTKQDGEPSAFKVLHMSLPSLLSFPLPTPTIGIPWDTVPCPIWMVGKHILIDGRVRVQSPNENVCWSDTGGKKAVSYCFFCFFCGWLDDSFTLKDRLGTWNLFWKPGKRH